MRVGLFKKGGMRMSFFNFKKKKKEAKMPAENTNLLYILQVILK